MMAVLGLVLVVVETGEGIKWWDSVGEAWGACGGCSGADGVTPGGGGERAQDEDEDAGIDRCQRESMTRTPVQGPTSGWP